MFLTVILHVNSTPVNIKIMLHKYSLGYKRCFSASRERDISLEIVYLTNALFKHFNPFEG